MHQARVQQQGRRAKINNGVFEAGIGADGINSKLFVHVQREALEGEEFSITYGYGYWAAIEVNEAALPVATPRLHMSDRSNTGFKGVSEMYSLQPNGSARVSKQFRMRHGRQKTAGAVELYFRTALEAAEAYAKHAGTYDIPPP